MPAWKPAAPQVWKPALRKKWRFRTNEPKLLTPQNSYKKLIFINLHIKRTCAQENNTMKNEPKHRKKGLKAESGKLKAES
jgi:hypothetical protein